MTTTRETVKDIWAESQDILGRKHVARYLTNYMTKRYEAKPYENGFVLAIDADWGFGKTFLLQNWRDELIQTGYVATYFDAWKNDFTPEPLIAFIAELNTALAPQFKAVPLATQLFKKAKGNISRLWKPLALVAVGAGLKMTTGVALDTLKNAMSDEDSSDTDPKTAPTKESPTKGLEKIFEDTLKQHKGKRESIEAFRQSMGLLIDALEKSPIQLPLFIFIDELDRCRPNYAIELLEGIKHLFGIPGIFFVVATNINQLGESTKAIYGPNFDGHRYLKRFFDMEYSLPKVQGIAFAEELFKKIASPSQNIVTGLERISTNETQKTIHYIFCQYADYFERGLRDQQQIIRIVEAAFLTLTDKPIHIHFLFFLAMLYHKSPSVYEAVVSSNSMHSATGYSELKINSSQGIFETIGRDQYGSTTRPTETHRIDKIASMYLKATQENVSDIMRENINTLDFPQNLREIIGRELQGGYTPGAKYPTSVKKYPDVIRQAGGFITPDKNKEDA